MLDQCRLRATWHVHCWQMFMRKGKSFCTLFNKKNPPISNNLRHHCSAAHDRVLLERLADGLTYYRPIPQQPTVMYLFSIYYFPAPLYCMNPGRSTLHPNPYYLPSLTGSARRRTTQVKHGQSSRVGLGRQRGGCLLCEVITTTTMRL